MRVCKAIITVATGKRGTRQFPVQRAVAYTTSEALDNDADSFSIDIGDSDNKLALCLDRDNEVRVQLFLDNLKGNLVPIFNGIADTAHKSEDFILSLAGRDTPSSLAVDSDAFPGVWKRINPTTFLTQRAHELGITQTKFAKMSQIGKLVTDGSEKEWAFWYRVVRMKGMYMWSTPTGALVINRLGYALSPAYRFGHAPRGDHSTWLPVEAMPQSSNKQGRIRKVLVYGMKGGINVKNKGLPQPLVAQGIDTQIGAWRKKPLMILTDAEAKNQAALQKTADSEIFESIVGTQSFELTIRDSGMLIEQNKMCLVNLPEYGIVMEPWFIVGVDRQGGEGGMDQVVRLREKNFAVTKRVPSAPTLKNIKSIADDKPAASIATALAGMGDIRWADSFVRATDEFGVKAGWDRALFLGVLLAICEKESTFQNEREGDSGVEWMPYADWEAQQSDTAQTKARAAIRTSYNHKWANEKANPFNPYRTRSTSAEAGVGPMQLTYHKFKEWADSYGWDGVAKSDEYEGGRWNTDSNIRASARALIEFLKTAHADPMNPDTIWLGVKLYNGRQAYADAVRSLYINTYKANVEAAAAAATTLPAGSTNTTISIPGHGQLILPANTPDEARKAINFALRRDGDGYLKGGAGPKYDCSSFVTAALASAAVYLRQELDEPNQDTGNHGDTTYTLYKKGRFKAVTKENCKPADLVFFNGDPPEHVGLYLEDDLFIHASNPARGVVIDSLNEAARQDGWTGARRVVKWEPVPVATDQGGDWFDTVGKAGVKVYTVEKLKKPMGGSVDQTKPAAGVMHTTEGSTFTGAIDTLNKNTDWPTFMVGVEAGGGVRVAQFYPFGTASRALKHTGSPETNNWARAQIEIVGSSVFSAWQPTNPTFDALAALMAALSKPPWNIPLTRPGGWADTYDTTRRLSGVWGAQAGWFGHVEMPENDHIDPGALRYSNLFTRAADFV